MPKEQPPVAYFYSVNLLLALNVAAFRKRDALERVKRFAASLEGVLEATGGPAFELTRFGAKVIGRERLVTDQEKAERAARSPKQGHA